ncbi:hypothetical protein NHQ30_007861 [Ciborinia camelliae]|nr:hypothetical protein NHQ30_007861 [Ciborinia camelliae]
MSGLSFFPFNQDHPDFPAELRTAKTRHRKRDAESASETIVLQDPRMNHSYMFERGCRKAFSGIFRHGNKEFRLIENMNPDILYDFFFDIRHSSNTSEHADITPAVRGVRETPKFFFVSCDYHDPEHVIVRTYPYLRIFDWNEQVHIDNLNLFREAAITEACGAITFGKDGLPLSTDDIKSIIHTETSMAQKTRKQKVAATTEALNEEEERSVGEPSTHFETQSQAMSATSIQPAAQPSQLQLTAPPFQPSSLGSEPSPELLAQSQQHEYPQGSHPFPNQGAIPQPVEQSYNQHAIPQHAPHPGLNQFQSQGPDIHEHNQPLGSMTFQNQEHEMPQQLGQQPHFSQFQNQGYTPQHDKSHDYTALQIRGDTMPQHNGQQGSNRFRNQDIVAPRPLHALRHFQQYREQRYREYAILQHEQQASNQYQQGASNDAVGGEIAFQGPSNTGSSQDQQGESADTDGEEMVPQTILSSMNAQDLADAFTDTDMTLTKFSNM